MKCPNCGAPMGLEDKYCTYCGTPNMQALRHQADMEKYQQEYLKTQQDVMEKTGRLRRSGSWLVILVVLLIAMIASIILFARAWDIGYTLREKKLTKEMPHHKAVLEAYLEEGEYSQFYGYYSSNSLSLGDDYSYEAVYRASRSYVNIIEIAASVHDPDNFRFQEKYRTENCEYLAEDLIRLFTVEEDLSYYADEALTEDKLAYVEDMRDRIRAVARTCFGLTEEEIDRIPELSKGKLGAMIGEGIAS